MLDRLKAAHRMTLLKLIASILLGTMVLGGASDISKAEDIQCRLSSAWLSYNSGDRPDLRVEIINLGKNEVVLPGSLDGSEKRSRYPHAFFTVVGPDGQIEPDRLVGCGNTNEPREQDFVTLGPLEAMNPYRQIDDGGFWSSDLLRNITLDQPGDYVFTFHYSTAAPDLDAWRGGPVCPTCPLDRGVALLLNKVPKVSVSCSTKVSVVDR